MNSLNILSHIGNTPPPSPPRSRAGSESNTLRARSPLASPYISNDAGTDTIASLNQTGNMVAVRGDGSAYPNADAGASHFDEKTPLLSQPREEFQYTQKPTGWQLPQRVSRAFVGTMKVLLTPIVISGQFMIACFYDDVGGHYSLLAPVYHISRSFKRTRRKTTMSTSDTSGTQKEMRKSRRISVSQTQSKTKKSMRRSPSITSSSAITSDSEIESERPPTRDEDNDTPSRHTRSKSTASSTTEEIAPAKRSIRIKLHNEEALRQRKSTRQPSRSGPSRGGSMQVSAEAAAALKSPTSPGTVSSKQLTRFPRAPQPPRPLVPRRQPSYSAAGASALGPHQKTLILDLDETLIHSMAKGGRFTTGHMVEVKLQEPVNAGQGQIIGPQIPILYYVHKRPHCDEFLKKVCKWYNLVIFTASVQEYADPVIDWLEVERKYFAGRYYRQHCTLRNGSYIKDLAQVEPDLSKVMIIDNNATCYIFHEDNAIPIEGWISDPTDTDLLHLIPLLEGLQYVTDVRALLALRLGEPQSA